MENGALNIQGTIIHSDDAIFHKISEGGSLFMKNSSSTTPNSQIKVKWECGDKGTRQRLH